MIVRRPTRARSFQKSINPRSLLACLAVVYFILLFLQICMHSPNDTQHVDVRLQALAQYKGDAQRHAKDVPAKQQHDSNDEDHEDAAEDMEHQEPEEKHWQKPRLQRRSAHMPPLLQEVLDEYYVQHKRPYRGDLWKISNYIPQWMKEYFEWHRKTRARLTSENWDQHSYLIVQCIDGQDNHCGGTADRLKSFPTLTRIAQEQERLLFIYWTLPAHLEDFLLPPQGGIDWRLPPVLEPIIQNKTEGDKMRKLIFIEKADPIINFILRTRLQSQTGGADHYNNKTKATDTYTFEQIYHDIWRIFFTPSKPIVDGVQRLFKTSHLVPGEYSASHLRALYGYNKMDTRDELTVQDWTHNALRCATVLRPNGPIYFTSDHNHAILSASRLAFQNSIKVVVRHRDKQPLHLDKEAGRIRDPAVFYDTFIDLYMMGYGRCVSYNRGGYGTWGLLIGYDSSCSINQKTTMHGYAVKCDWTFDRDAKAPKPTGAPLFVDAMPPQVPALTWKPQVAKIVAAPHIVTAAQQQDDPPRDHTDDAAVSFVGDENRRLVEEGLPKDKLPQWMQEYLSWHKEERRRLDETRDWNSTKYLILECQTNQHACGGVSDRLKPLPLLVLLAHRSKRLLLIWWTRPCGLEEFLVPPKGGVDWSVPEWLQPHVNEKQLYDKSITITVHRLKYHTQQLTIRTRIQTPGGGEDYYNAQDEVDSTFESVFHQLFRYFFEPSERLQRKIDANMETYGLRPGKYAAAHFRVMYGGRKFRPANETIHLTVNAINCASELYHGGPVYFAGDIKFAVDVAQEYGKQRSIGVASLDFNDDPLHFDKDKEWAEREPSEYDDTFIDLYMLGNSRCVTYSNGGYGSFGQLLSYDSKCSVRHYQKHEIAKNCTWTNVAGVPEDLEPPEMIIPEELQNDLAAKQ